MMAYEKNAERKKRGMLAALFLGCAVAFLVAGLSLAASRSAPPGTRWLGGGIINTTDMAVYLSYLRQGGDGHALLSDLYAVEPHVRRFDLVWSVLGLFVRLGVSPLLVHESARVVSIIFLTLVLYAAAHDLFKKQRDAFLATFLCLGGISTGWLYSLWLTLRHAWSPLSGAIPDLTSEFGLGLILLGGVHGILSVSLLVSAVRFIWKTFHEPTKYSLLLALLSSTTLLAFHPYFVPLLGIFTLVAFRLSGKDGSRLHLFLLLLSFLLPTAYYIWLLQDPVFGQHHLVANILELDPFPIWIITLLPFIGAAFWMWRSRVKQHTTPEKTWLQRLDWRHVWIISAVLCLILLPVPWKRKLTEGLLIASVLLTMPAWFAIREAVFKSPARVLRVLTASLLLVAAWLGPIHLFVSYLQWIKNPHETAIFYQPDALFRLAEEIHTNTPANAVLLSDDPWINNWLPALTGRRVWLGHNHETPNFARKRQEFHAFLDSQNPDETQTFLDQNGVTLFLTTPASAEKPWQELLPSWNPWIQDGGMIVWKKL